MVELLEWLLNNNSILTLTPRSWFVFVDEVVGPVWILVRVDFDDLIICDEEMGKTATREWVG